MKGGIVHGAMDDLSRHGHRHDVSDMAERALQLLALRLSRRPTVRCTSHRRNSPDVADPTGSPSPNLPRDILCRTTGSFPRFQRFDSIASQIPPSRLSPLNSSHIVTTAASLGSYTGDVVFPARTNPTRLRTSLITMASHGPNCRKAFVSQAVRE